jgi:hypothetical protein
MGAAHVAKFTWKRDGYRHSLRANLARCEGHYAVMVGRRVVGFFDDPEIACARARERYGPGSYTVRRVDDEPAFA